MSILQKYLKILGVNEEDLRADEKETFRIWKEALEGKEITNEDFKKWLVQRKEQLIDILVDPEAPDQKKSSFAAELRLIRAIINFVELPSRAKEATEKHLEDLVKKSSN